MASRDAKSSSREHEAGALALESLRRQVSLVCFLPSKREKAGLMLLQVLPFIMRRMKEDVLKELPPKIIQDYYCDLSPLQVIYCTLHYPFYIL